MENSSFKKQAKSDIFKELQPTISFYIKKGAKPKALKKYYKNNKRFNDILEDIRNKGINLVKDEQEYKNIVREILNDILDDFIAKEKDEEYKNKQNSKMKHIKEFYNFEINEDFTTFQNILLGVGTGICLYKFLKGLLFDIIDRNIDKIVNKIEKNELSLLAKRVEEYLNDGGKIKFSEDFVYYTFELDELVIKINKQKKYLTYSNEKSGDKYDNHHKASHGIPLSQEEIDGLISSLKEEENND